MVEVCIRKLKEKINDNNFNQSLQSYLGYLSHANSYNLSLRIKEELVAYSVSPDSNSKVFMSGRDFPTTP